MTFCSFPEYKGLVEPTVEFICDLLHIHPLVVQLILLTKNSDHIAVVTDAIMKPKSTSKAKFNGRDVEVKDSKVVLGGSTTLAGSCSTQLFMFQTLVNKFGGMITKKIVLILFSDFGQGLKNVVRKPCKNSKNR